MFTDEQIRFMKRIGVPVKDYSHMSEDDQIMIEDYVGDYLDLNCLDDDYNPNEDGLMCYSILDSLD